MIVTSPSAARKSAKGHIVAEGPKTVKQNDCPAMHRRQLTFAFNLFQLRLALIERSPGMTAIVAVQQPAMSRERIPLDSPIVEEQLVAPKLYAAQSLRRQAGGSARNRYGFWLRRSNKYWICRQKILRQKRGRQAAHTGAKRNRRAPAVAQQPNAVPTRQAPHQGNRDDCQANQISDASVHS